MKPELGLALQTKCKLGLDSHNCGTKLVNYVTYEWELYLDAALPHMK